MNTNMSCKYKISNLKKEYFEAALYGKQGFVSVRTFLEKRPHSCISTKKDF